MKPVKKTAQPCVDISQNGFRFSVFHPENIGVRGAHYGWDRSRIVWRIEHIATEWSDAHKHKIDSDGLGEMNIYINDAADTMQHFVNAPTQSDVRRIMFKITQALLKPERVVNANELSLVDSILKD